MEQEIYTVIIDFHTHIFHPDLAENRTEALSDGGFGLLYSDPGARISDSEGLSSYINESGIDGAVAMSFPWEEKALCSLHNRYMAETGEKYRGSVFPFGMVPLCETSGIRDCVREIKASGLCGIGEIAFYRKGFDMDSRNYLRAVLEAAGDFSLPVCLHVNEPLGHSYTGKYEPSFGALYEIISDFREVTVILSHWGGGLLFYELMPEVGSAFKNVYYDTAASPFLYDREIYSHAVEIIGNSRILFGSDFPLLKFKRYDDEMKAVLPEDDYAAVAGLNAASLLGL